jgi:hypothetical protein
VDLMTPALSTTMPIPLQTESYDANLMNLNLNDLVPAASGNVQIQTLFSGCNFNGSFTFRFISK